MKISNRLKSIAGLVYQNDSIVDIGCDHALLDIYLIKNNIVKSTMAVDVNKNALESGKNNIAKYFLKDKITLYLANGLEKIDSSINTAIISGMGTNSIIKILMHSNLKYINKLIIQSNSDYYLLRRVITLKGFYISHESVIYEKGKYYINIVFLRGYKKYSNKELKYGPILMYSNKNYFDFLMKKQEQILDNIPVYKIFLRLKILKELNYLKKLSK